MIFMLYLTHLLGKQRTRKNRFKEKRTVAHLKIHSRINEENLPLCPFSFFAGFSNRPFSNSSIIFPTFWPSSFFRDNRNCSFSKLIWETQKVEEWEERDEREEEEEEEEKEKEEEEEGE